MTIGRDPVGSQGRSTEITDPRYGYVVPAGMLIQEGGEELSLKKLWEIVWRGKWVILSITAAAATVALIYALSATEWYRADVLLAPAEERSTPALGGQLGGLAALAGVSVGGGDSAQAIATLRSREFARSFIDDFNLLPVLFSDAWDSEGNQWSKEFRDQEPDIRDAVKYFRDKVLVVHEDRQTRLVTLAVEWKDPVVAALWAEALVNRVNSLVRARALDEAEANVAYLRNELDQASVVTLQQSISRLLESEMQKLMLARGNEEFAFRVIDPPATPKYRERPRRALIVLIGVAAGGALGGLVVLLSHAVRAESEGARQA